MYILYFVYNYTLFVHKPGKRQESNIRNCTEGKQIISARFLLYFCLSYI